MIIVEFFKGSDGVTAGFCVKGHSGMSEAGTDIVCAAVSSAVYLTANTITDVLKLNPSVEVKDGFLRLIFKTKDQALKAQTVTDGLELHLKGLEEDYPKNVKVKYGGVQNA